jgi:hypothetical protein
MKYLWAITAVVFAACSSPRSEMHASSTRLKLAVEPGGELILDGPGALSAAHVTYQWTQTAGPAVELSSNTAESPSFTVPAVYVPTTLSFQLVATSIATVTVDIGPAVPLDSGVDTSLLDVGEVESDVLGCADVRDTVADLPPPPPLGMFSDVSASSGFAAITSRNGGLSWCFDVTVEDIDNDGRNDIFVGNHSADRRLALGDGAGSFFEQLLPSSTAATWADMAMDWNNDGLTDVSQNSDSAEHGVFQSVGNRVFVARTGAESIATSSNGMAWADWNGDGYPDYAMVKFGASNKMLLGSSADTFSVVSGGYGVLPSAQYMHSTLIFADFDGDDFPDMLTQPLIGTIFSGSGLTTVLARNTTAVLGGSASFATVTDSGLSGMPGPAVAVGDFDNDGDLDIFAMGSTAANSARLGYGLYQNDGTGHFTNVTSSAGLPTATRSADLYYVLYLKSAFVDFDGDGLLDIVAVEYSKERLFHNVGGAFVEVTGQFGFGGTNSAMARPARAAVGDVDGDHVPDIVVMRAVPGSSCDVRVMQNGVRTDNGLAVKLTGSAIKNAVGSKIYLYEANTDGGNGPLVGYREVMLSTTHKAPLEQYFALTIGKNYNMRTRFWPSGTVVDTHLVSPGRIVVQEQ